MKKIFEFFFVVVPFLLFWMLSGWLEKDFQDSVKNIKKINRYE